MRRRSALDDGIAEFSYIHDMQLTVNGEALEAPDGTNVLSLVKRLGLDQGPVAVERNREVVPRSAHESTLLAEHDVIEIVHFVGGG